MKKHFKRICTIGLASALIVGTLAGCGGQKNTSGSGSGNQASGETISFKLASMNGEVHSSGNAWRFI